MMEIREVDWGIANRFDDGIEINKHLKENPQLYRAILKHELGHDDSLWSWDDFKHDLVRDEKISQWDIIRFMIRHPKSLTQLLPFYYSRKRGLVLDINMIIMYVVLFTFLGAVIFFGLKFF